jgi:hypothetical protein
MARDLSKLDDRNKDIRAAYNKLKCEEQIIKLGDKRVAIHLTYSQILEVLATKFYLSTKRVEYILSVTAPQMAPLQHTQTLQATAA